MKLLRRRDPETIETSRLELRPLAVGHAKRIALLAGDFDVARMTARIPHPYTTADARAWLDTLDPSEVVRGIFRGRTLVGACGYTRAANASAEIGYWIGKPYWGRGYATESAAALVAHAFNGAGLARLTCGHLVDNAASARVIAKLGFRRFGFDRVWCEARGMWMPALRYELMKPADAG
jgi:RimJ/RimL family protein N-acetyltransferase